MPFRLISKLFFLPFDIIAIFIYNFLYAMIKYICLYVTMITFINMSHYFCVLILVDFHLLMFFMFCFAIILLCACSDYLSSHYLHTFTMSSNSCSSIRFFPLSLSFRPNRNLSCQHKQAIMCAPITQ